MEDSEDNTNLSSTIKTDADDESASETVPAEEESRCSIYCVYVLAILSNFIFYCSELPLLRLTENKICFTYLGAQSSSHFLDHGIDESRCKTPKIQNELALFIGAKTAFDALPPLLTSFWYGNLADRMGRRGVIALACTGELFNLLWVLFVCFFNYVHDYQVAWLAALFLLVGGGQFLLYAMFSLAIVDVAKEAERTAALSILHSITLLSSLFGAPVAAVLMRQSLLLPFLVMVVLSLIRYPVIWWLPETGPSSRTRKVGEHSLRTVSLPASETDLLLPDDNTQPQGPNSICSLASNVVVVLRAPAVPFCMICFLVKRIAFTSEALMFQHISKLLRQPLSETAWLRVPIGLAATIVLTSVLPALSQRWKRNTEVGIAVDLWAVRTSLAILIAGFGLFWRASLPFVIALALLLCGAGEGLAPSLQSLVSDAVDPKYHSDLFATISVVDTIAKLVGGPVMAKTFAIRDSDGKSYGFCFLLSAVLFTLLLCSSWTKELRAINLIVSH